MMGSFHGPGGNFAVDDNWLSNLISMYRKRRKVRKKTRKERSE